MRGREQPEQHSTAKVARPRWHGCSPGSLLVKGRDSWGGTSRHRRDDSGRAGTERGCSAWFALWDTGMSVLANEAPGGGNALPVRALVKQGWLVSAGAAVPGEAPPCSAPCPGAAGGAGEPIPPGLCHRGAEEVAEQPCQRVPEQPCHLCRGSARLSPGLEQPRGCSEPLPVPWVGTAVRDRLGWTPSPACSGHGGDPNPRRAQHISIPGSRVRPHGGCSPGEGIEGGLAV